MFEVRTALAYLLPRRGQMSVSVVGLIAVLVVQAITWLVLVFFSTTEGFETKWTQKIVNVLGPVRVVFAHDFFESPWYSLDFYSSRSGFFGRRMSARASEKQLVYDSLEDPALPPTIQSWHALHSQENEPVSDFVRRLQKEGIHYRFFETTVCHLSIPSLSFCPQKSLSQYSVLMGFDALRLPLHMSLAELTPREVESLLSLLQKNNDDAIELLQSFVSAIGSIDIVATQDIEFPQTHVKIAKGTVLSATISYDKEPLLTVVLPKQDKNVVSMNSGAPETIVWPLRTYVPPISVVRVTLLHAPLLLAHPEQEYVSLPFVRTFGYPVLVPKAIRQQCGVRFFDKGSLCSSPEKGESLSLPFYVAGFYDPGIMPTGGKLAITSQQAVLALSPELSTEIPLAPSGIIVDTQDHSLAKTEQIVRKICEKKFPTIFKVERYNQYESTAELYQQLSSEKLLFKLLSLIIIVVACSNIFSMLFILAHDRRKEIAVLRALGASSLSVISIFILAGFGVGFIGSSVGSFFACITLHYLPEVLGFIGSFQGHEILQKTIYGEIVSQSISPGMLVFTLSTVSLASAVAGGLAAIRACRINVSDSLKAGG